MSACKTITIICDRCRKTITTSEFKDIPSARRLTKETHGLKVKQAKNGCMLDICETCNDSDKA